MGVDPARPTIPAERLRTRVTPFPRKLSPAADARCADREPRAGFAMA